jgi:acetyl esterase/lipase
MPLLLLIVSLVGCVFTFNAFRPRYAPAGLAAVSFVSGWLTAELALHQVFIQGILVAVLVRGGALAAWPGKLGLGLCFASWLLLWICWRGADSREAIDDALGHLDDEDELVGPTLVEDVDSRGAWRQLVFPIPVTHPKVERLRDLVYFEEGRLRLKLDVHRRRGADHGPAALRPALVFIHGGAWVLGSKDHHGLPMLQHFAARGWVCFSINYRLSPRATFPDHLVDVKRALAWVRAHAAEYGADPGFVVVSGGSAGGHLASLAALTQNRPEFQPGFEREDTSVAACISFYGIYDFTDRHGHWPNPGLLRLLERHVMKARLVEARDAYAAASPITYLDERAPPFLLVHGDRDSLVPVAEGRAFFAALQAVSRAPSAYFEIPGAQHAFEIFPSPRTLHVLRGVERFAGYVHGRYAAGSPSARAGELPND